MDDLTNFDDDGWTNIDGVTRVLDYSLPISVEVLDTSESKHHDPYVTHDTGDRPGVAIFAPTEIKVFIGAEEAFHYDLIAILEAQGILTQQPGDFRAFSSDLGPVVCFRVYPDGTIEDWYGNNSSDWTDTVEIPRPPPEFESAVKSELQRVAPVMGPVQGDFKFGSNEDVEIIDLTGIEDRFGRHDSFISEVGDEPNKRSFDWPIIIVPVENRWTVFVGRENGFHTEIEEDPEFERQMYGSDVFSRKWYEEVGYNRYPSGRQYVPEEIQKDLDEFLGITPGFKFGAAELEINVIDFIRESDNGSEHDDEGGGVSHPVYIYRGMRMRWDQSSEGLLAPIINMYIGAEGAYHSDIPYKWLAPIIKDLTFVAQCRYDGELWGYGLENLSESEKAACEAKLNEFFGTPKDFKFGADNKPFGTGWEAFDPQKGEGIVDHFLGDPDFSFSDRQPAQPDNSQANAFAKDDELDAPIFANILRNWVNSFENENESGIPSSDFLSGEKKSTSRIQKVLDKFRRKSEQVRVELDEEDLKFGACEECGFNHKPGPCPKSMGGPMIIPEEPTDISELKNLSEEGQGDDEGAKKKSRAILSHVELLDLRGVEAEYGYPSHGEYIFESDQQGDPRLHKLYPVVAWDERRINPDATHGWSVAIGREDGFHDEMKNKLPDGVVNQYGSYDFFGRFSPPNDLALYERPSDASFVPENVKAEMITALNGLVGGGASEFHFGSSRFAAGELTPVWLDDDGRVVGTGRANKGIIIPREGDELGGYSLIVLPEQGQIWIGSVPDIHHVIIEKALREAGLEDAPRFSFWTRFDRLMPDFVDPNNPEAAALAPAICEALGLPDYPLADLDDLRKSESPEDFHFGAATEFGTDVLISQDPDEHRVFNKDRAPFIYCPVNNALYVGVFGQYHDDLVEEFDIRGAWTEADFDLRGGFGPDTHGEYWRRVPGDGSFIPPSYDSLQWFNDEGTEPEAGLNDALINIFSDPAQEEEGFRFGAAGNYRTRQGVTVFRSQNDWDDGDHAAFDDLPTDYLDSREAKQWLPHPYETDEYMRGQCAAWADAHQDEYPHLRFGVDWERMTPDHPSYKDYKEDMGEDPEDGEWWRPQHYFTHDDNHWYDVEGAHPLSELPQWDRHTLNEDNVWFHGDLESGSKPDPEWVRRYAPVPKQSSSDWYHVAPKAYRESILKNGIQPNQQKGFSGSDFGDDVYDNEGHEPPVYLTKNPNFVGIDLPNDPSDYDVWKVKPQKPLLADAGCLYEHGFDYGGDEEEPLMYPSKYTESNHPELAAMFPNPSGLESLDHSGVINYTGTAAHPGGIDPEHIELANQKQSAVNDALRNIFPADEVLDEQEDFRFGAFDELNTPKVVYIKFQPNEVHKSPELDAPWFYLPEDNAVYFGPPGGYHYEMLSQDSEFRNKFLNGDGASAITFWMKALQEGTFLSGRVTWPPNSHASGPPREDQQISFYGSPTPDQVEMINRALGQPDLQPGGGLRGRARGQGGDEFHFGAAEDNVGQSVRQIVASNPVIQPVVEALMAAGGQVYAVGGAVRDTIMGKTPKDIDLMVSGIPKENIDSVLAPLGGDIDYTGKDFGVFRYKQGGEEVEIALPRHEQSTGDKHTDFSVDADHTLSPEEDLLRRDFTANAMAVNLGTGELIDPHNGAEDIAGGRLRTIHDQSLSEDPLRVARALVAKGRHGLNPDEGTIAQMAEAAASLQHLPAERVQAELDKIFSSDDPVGAIRLAHDSGVLKYILPEVDATFGYDQNNPHHALELGEHMLDVLDRISQKTDDPDARLAGLLHDIGKPASAWVNPERGTNHYYQKRLPDGSTIGQQHELVGEEMTRDAMTRLRYPKDRTDRVSDIVKHHMFAPFDSEKGARKFLNRVEPHADDLLNLRWADQAAKGEGQDAFDDNEYEVQRGLVDQVRQQQQPTDLSQLAINGQDLIEAGFPQGPEIGQILESLMGQVIGDPSINERDKLLNLALGRTSSVFDWKESGL